MILRCKAEAQRAIQTTQRAGGQARARERGVKEFSLKAFFLSLEKYNKITKHQRDVLLAVLSFFGKDGCFPSHAKIAEEANVSERTVRNTLREARLRGWIDWTNKWNGRFQSSNRYCFTIDHKYISKIRDAVNAIKKKTAVFQYVHRLHVKNPSNAHEDFTNLKDRKFNWVIA